MAIPKLTRSRMIATPVVAYRPVPASRQIAPAYPGVQPMPRPTSASASNRWFHKLFTLKPVVIGGAKPTFALVKRRRSGGNKPGVYYRRDKFGVMHRIESRRAYTQHDTAYWQGRRLRSAMKRR